MAPSTRSRTKRPTGVPSQDTSPFISSHGDLRQVRERLAHLLRRVLVVLELAVHVALIRTEIEVAVPGQIERDRLRFSGFLTTKCLVDDDADRVGRLGRGQVAFSARE